MARYEVIVKVRFNVRADSKKSAREVVKEQMQDAADAACGLYEFEVKRAQLESPEDDA